MWKNYKAIFFDWDGTAVMSRKAPADEAVQAMKPLLRKGVKLAIISGTTIENIAGGKLESYFTKAELENLYLGLAVQAMKPLLRKGVKLAIISGTTIENIAGGKLESYFTKAELENLYLGLGRGAYNYAFRDGKPYIFKNMVPEKEELLTIHRICFEIHEELKGKTLYFQKYGARKRGAFNHSQDLF